MYFFRTFKKSTAPYKVHNMGLGYIKTYIERHSLYRKNQTESERDYHCNSGVSMICIQYVRVLLGL
jgi:hypothetical protein